ncbi:hypothetical protein [Actinobacillus pleuropneumoniae]|uniref:hypothetical protein n=1 Tax=Actinobacillus pleuropneumoniae TaxID=715 RepID=UPI0005846A8C|nr:hypothetical protein [Actinobacillus pleuropneumoniae]KIE89496.1 putative valyl-tRNA synthetase [Actinobacillus pleuropneumoniae]QXP23541.1 NgoFVII family restriction endonuclease [Actinobacillus pleuropneumoniae serovar 8 str. 405]UKH37545.1 NgoFVII family restriction endonuclease [Actinobacillus pleuropneumoniae serovar 8 str. 405]CUU52921.1 hypothetical protein MIDG2331_01668 [Actinobacillus pleuropneumoniae serovar 8]
MKKVAIFFRNKKSPNIFREVILDSLASEFDKCTICSAFFQHPYKNKKNKTIGKFSTSQEILSSLNKCNCHKKEISIYGLYASNNWPTQYMLTCQSLNNRLSCCCTFKFFKFKNKKSHAKIFVAKTLKNKKYEPTLAIIGSSNLSAGAFSSQNTNWNQECDVIFWDENCSKANGIMKKYLELIQEEQSTLFITNYDEEENKYPLSQKLSLLEKQIIESSEEYNLFN